MKKFLILALMLLGPRLVLASTPTVTPTSTVTPTFIPTPSAQLDASLGRDYTYPNAIFATDGVTLASAVTTPVPGSAAPWIAQSISQTAFVMGTNTASVRWTYGIRGDFAKGVNAPNMNVWAYCSTTSTANAITMTLNVSRRSMNNLYPQGETVYLGTATSVTNQLTNSSITAKVLRIKLPMPSTARFQVGDQLNFDLSRSGGATSDLYIYRIENEYLVNPYHYR